MKIEIKMTQKEIKDTMRRLETASHILYSIARQCPARIKKNKLIKLNVGGGKRWWEDASDAMEALRGKFAPYKVSERHEKVFLKPRLGLGEGLPRIEIDKGVVPLVKELWSKEIRTYECCQGGYDGEEGSENDRGWIILHAEDFIKAKKILTKYVGRWVMEFGTGGYCPEEYNKSVTKNDTFVYVSWKSK